MKFKKIITGNLILFFSFFIFSMPVFALEPIFDISAFGQRFVTNALSNNVDFSELNSDNTLVICGQFRWNDGDYRAMCYVVPNYTSDLISFSGSNSNFTLSHVPKYYYYYETYNNSNYMYAKSFEVRTNGNISPYSELQDLYVISNYLPNDNNIIVDVRGLQFVPDFGIAETVVIPDFDNPDFDNFHGHSIGATYSQIVSGQYQNDEDLEQQQGHLQGYQNIINNNPVSSNDTDTSLFKKILNVIGSIGSSINSFFTNFWGNLNDLFSFYTYYLTEFFNSIKESFNYLTEVPNPQSYVAAFESSTIYTDFLSIENFIDSFIAQFSSVPEPTSYSIPIHFEDIGMFENVGTFYIDFTWLDSCKTLIRTFIAMVTVYSLVISIIDSIPNYINGGGGEDD